MADNLSTGGSNGEQARAETAKARDHLRAAGSAAADAIREKTDTFRENAAAAADAARSSARGASDWARSRFEDLQGRVEQRPQSAALWALGIGAIAGFLLGTLLRGGED
jgi:hypothetical protein